MLFARVRYPAPASPLPKFPPDDVKDSSVIFWQSLHFDQSISTMLVVVQLSPAIKK